MWKPISQYQCKDYDEGKEVLLWSEKDGMRIGCGSRYHIMEDSEGSEETYFASGEWNIKPTHFADLPLAPFKDRPRVCLDRLQIATLMHKARVCHSVDELSVTLDLLFEGK